MCVCFIPLVIVGYGMVWPQNDLCWFSSKSSRFPTEGFKQDVAGAWRALDSTMSGHQQGALCARVSLLLDAVDESHLSGALLWLDATSAVEITVFITMAEQGPESNITWPTKCQACRMPRMRRNADEGRTMMCPSVGFTKTHRFTIDGSYKSSNPTIKNQ